VDGSQQTIHFARDANGAVTGIRLEESGSLVTARRVEPLDAATVPLLDYVGTYHSEELDATYTLEIVSDTLMATNLRLGSITLTPHLRDSFMTNQWFIRELTFVRDGTGNVTGFRASNARVRGVLFEKRR
jgi:hypothetical protein